MKWHMFVYNKVRLNINQHKHIYIGTFVYERAQTLCTQGRF